MAVGTTTAILAASAAFSAGTSIVGANAQTKNIQRQAEYNAQIYDQQAEMIMQQKKIQDYQFTRQAAATRGSIISKTAGKGLNLGGSPLAILIDNETEMQFDKAILDYNTQINANYAKSGASYTRATGVQQSRLAKFSGYSNAFSTVLNAGAQIGMMNIYSRAGKL